MFDEEVFIVALTERPEDARRFAGVFHPQWLNKSEYSPILETLYEFTKEFGEPPSLPTLHKVLKERDEEAYDLRYKAAIEKIQTFSPDRSDMIFTLDQANNVAISRSFEQLVNDENFMISVKENAGQEILARIQHWIGHLGTSGDDKNLNLKEIVDELIQSAEFDSPNVRIPTGVQALDDWTGGGLRKKQTSILIAPTGHGKTTMLLVIGYKIATIERKNVLFVTNELVLSEVGERVLSRMTGVQLDKIIDDPTIAYKGLDHQWKQELEKRMRFLEYTRETSTDDLEAEIGKMKNLYGWKPDVIVLDYMERMKPSLSGYRRESEWTWLGAIAKDLVRMAKRHNILIWTAAQTNRAGLTAEEIDMSMSQGSIRHLQEATSVIAMHQKPIPNSDDVVLRLKALKMRQSKRANRPVNLRCDLSRMSIKNEEVDDEELNGTNDDDSSEDDDQSSGGHFSGRGSKPLSPRQRQKRGY